MNRKNTNKSSAFLSVAAIVFLLIGLLACVFSTIHKDTDTIQSTASGNECVYSNCGGNRTTGSRFCSRHTCSSDGCYSQSNTSTMFRYCDKHEEELTCIEPECYAPKYEYADSDYCKTHYINRIS